ncbi:MAG TPA: polysaccharide biosynthesis tyrosine autokinase [Vicinamibacterales bacterium]|nr:polysaccharide biosynthesis tyrosine autokinase [Vicinamibacterales bacterium]
MFDRQDLQPAPAVSDDPAAAPQQGPGANLPDHPLDRLIAICRHRRIAGTAFALVAGTLMLQSHTATPLYRASAQVLIQDERTTAVGSLNANDPMFWQETDQYYNTQYSILRSRGLARRVVHRLALQDHPLFNGKVHPARGPITVVGEARRIAASLLAKAFSRDERESREPPASDETAVESAGISAFLAGLQIVPEKSTRLVSIDYVSPDAQFAADAANAVADEYAAQNLDLRLDTIRKNLAWLEDEVKRQEKKVTETEAAMTQYREQQNALSLEDRQNIVVARLTALNDTVTRARTTRLQKEALHAQLEPVDPASDQADAFPAIAANPGVVEAKNRLAELTARRAQLSTRYRDGHPEMAKIDTQIASGRSALAAQRARVIEAARNDYESALREERSFSGQLEVQKAAAIDLDRKSGGYLVLQREAESNRQVHQALLQQEKELRVVSNSRTNNVRVMDRAEVPGAAFSPNLRRDWFTALVAGLLLALGLAVGLEYLDDTIKTPEDVSRRLRLALLGLVPAIRGAHVPLLSEAVPHDFGEAYRSLRTSLVFTSGADGPRVVAVTSTQPLEGKTTTACNLAMALAVGGARVLLVDADLRRPGLHRVMGLANEVGLSHLLVGQSRVREAVQQTREPNLLAITAGRVPPNPSELLASDRMKNLVASLQTGPFDWVIVDTPPVLAVTDAVLVSRVASGVVFVVGSEMTRRAHAARALEILRSGRPTSIGAVLNRVDFHRNKYYYSRYYGYRYQSYYGQGSSAPA